VWNQFIVNKKLKNHNYKLRYITNAGGWLSKEQISSLLMIFRDIDFYIMYGATESLRMTYLNVKENPEHMGSVGRALKNMTILIIDEKGNPCTVMQAGEIVASGDLVCSGYYGTENDDKFLFIEPYNCWFFRTGDLGYFDIFGYLYLVGRNNQMIKKRGYRISPYEIEDVVYSNFNINSCAVISLKNSKDDDIILFYTSKKYISENAFIKKLKKYLPNYMIPEKYIKIDKMPLLLNGKIDKTQLCKYCGNHSR
jgi:acyl-CoA synthetase (AMP-forming)/AMP-acid ligase II